jgi:thiol-disulfide isomerase/thioredoxin
MMKRFHRPSALLLLMALFGCGESATEPAPPASALKEPAAEPVKDAGAATTKVAPAVETAKSESTNEPAETEGTKKSGGSGKVAETEIAVAEPQPEPKPERDPLLEGLSFQGLDEQFATIKDAYTESPEDVHAVAQYLQIVEQLGTVQSRQGNQVTANAAFHRAGEILEKAMKAGVEVDNRLKGIVYYNYACVTSSDGNAETALSLIEKAMESGFSDLNQLQQDEELVAVRKLPGFAEKLAAWEAKAKERELEHARGDLAAAESFPFSFELTDVHGAPMNLVNFQGKVCIVDIWGTWCPPCRAEIPSFIKLQETYGSQGFQMVGLNQERAPTPEEQAQLVTSYIEENGINYPCALITEEVLSQVPDFSGFPTTLFIDRQGKVRLKAVGLHDYSYLEAVVSELLAEGASAAPAEDAASASDSTTTPAADLVPETP